MVFFWQSIFFLTTQFLGLGIAVKVSKVVAIEQIYTPEIMPWKILVVFAVLTIVLLLTLRLPRGKGFILRALFVLTSWWGGALALSVWMSDIFAFPIISALIILRLIWNKVFLHNIVVILGIAGVASVFGLRFAPETIIILLVIFSLYDVIAVFKTKHMVHLAKAMLEARSIFATIVPQKPSLFFANLKEVTLGKKFMVLGGGDIAFPLMLASSVSVNSLIDSLIITAFAFLGFTSTYILFVKLGRKPMPALPPIAIFSIVGFLVTKFI